MGLRATGKRSSRRESAGAGGREHSGTGLHSTGTEIHRDTSLADSGSTALRNAGRPRAGIAARLARWQAAESAAGDDRLWADAVSVNRLQLNARACQA